MSVIATSRIGRPLHQRRVKQKGKYGVIGVTMVIVVQNNWGILGPQTQLALSLEQVCLRD